MLSGGIKKDQWHEMGYIRSEELCLADGNMSKLKTKVVMRLVIGDMLTC